MVRPALIPVLLGVLCLGGGAGVPAAGQAVGSSVTTATDLQARARRGDAWAALNLAAAFDHGLAGYPRDPAQAVAWYREAAQAGLAEAQFNLAHCLATGHGTRRDEEEARHWMRRAASQGLADAQFLLAVMLIEGMGGAPDSRQADEWLQRASAAGHADAAALLERRRSAAAGD